MKYFYYFLIPASFLLSCTDNTLDGDNLDCSSICQVKDFLHAQGESPPDYIESMTFFENQEESFGILLYDIAEHPDNQMLRYQKALLFQFDEAEQLIQKETMVFDIFIEDKANTTDFIDIAKQYYLKSTTKLNVNGAIIAGHLNGGDQKMLKFEKDKLNFILIEDPRNEERENFKDCYTAWHGYYNQQGVFIAVYALYTWCDSAGGGGSGGSGSSGSQNGNWPKVCNKHRSLSWTGGLFGSYNSQVSARLTKLSASSWPSASVNHSPGIGGATYPGTINLSVSGGYIGNGKVDASAYLTHSITVAGNVASTDYGPKVVILQFAGNCY